MHEPPPDLAVTGIFILCSFLLVALNGFFVAAEFAIVKVRRTRLEELAGLGNAAATRSILLVDQLDDYLSATQLGITLVSLALGWMGEEAFFNLFRILFPALIDSNATAHGVAVGASFFFITVLHVVLGELVPKSMAIQQAEKITLWVSRPLHIFYLIAKPLINAFTSLANFVLRIIGYHGLEEQPLSEEELKMVMKESHEDGVISESEAQIINRAFSFSDKVAADIMIPAEKVQYLSLKRSLEENMKITEKRIEAFRKVARKPVFVDPKLKQDRIMKIFKDTRSHLAIVQDPATKKNVGIVTMEDVLEGIVGEILDEHGN
ncbi:MAG: HlyC/CorC family transporter [Proteobacteria bacterium]|nr:MAG: HlyC/CorC family transporter [Pseudomonadota bacterium]